MSWVPLCFDSARQYDQWARLARKAGIDPLWPCVDCTAAYQQRMTAAGRCAYPDTVLEDADPCPAPSAAANLAASSGRTQPPGKRRGRPKGSRNADKKVGRKSSPSVPTAASSSSPRSGTSGKTGAEGAKKTLRRTP